MRFEARIVAGGIAALATVSGLAAAVFAWTTAPASALAGAAAGAGFLLALAYQRLDARRQTARIREFASEARRDLGGIAFLDESGSSDWQQSARALNAWVASLQQHVHDETRVRDRLETVIGALDDAFLVVSRAGRVLFANERLGALFSVPEQPVGRTMLEVVRDRTVLREIEAALGGEPRAGELRLDFAGQLDVRYRISPFPATNGGDGGRGTGDAAGGAVAIFHDITELRRAEKARRDFLANASHEIKTPLSAVRGYAEILADRDLGDPTSKRAIEAILNNAKRLTALVEDLLELSRIEGGALNLDSQPFDAGEVARSLLRDFDTRARAARVETSLEVRGDTEIVGDRRVFEQVIGNLVDNALKYTPAGGAVTVLAGPAERGDRLRVEVRDNGPGIAQRHQHRVFERFYRVDPGRSRALGGTGLGLAIVKHLVTEAMGGEVGLESTPGKGSCFSVELPRHQQDGAAPSQTVR